jgi:PKD repeat protein
MKTTQSILLFFALMLAGSCDLEKIEAPALTCPGNLKASFSNDKSACEAPCTITFASTSTGANSYQWKFDNGQSASVEKPAPITYTTPGNYRVKLLVGSAAGCKDSSEVSINITAPPQKVFACFTFTADNIATAPSKVSFDAACSQNAQGATFSWDFGDPDSGANNTASGQTPTHNYSAAGEYKVKLLVQGQTSDDTTITVKIKAPVLTACFTHTSNNNYIAPTTVSFKAECSKNALAYNWNFGDPASGSNNTAVGINPSHNYAQPGTYNVKLLIQSGATNKDTTLPVVIKAPPPVANFTVSNDNCLAPCTVSFTNSSSNATAYSWNFGDGTTSTQTSPSKLYNEGKTYAVTLTATGPGGTATATKNVKVRAGVRKIINLGAEVATPLAGLEKSAGLYHVLYQNSLGQTKTIALDGEGVQSGAVSTHNVTAGSSNTEQVDATSTSDGRFILIGNNYNTSKVWVSGVTHGTTAWNRDYHFGGSANASQAANVVDIGSNRIAITGLYIITGDGGGGLIVMPTDGGTPLVNAKVLDTNADAVISPVTLAQNLSGGYNFFCSQFTFGGTASRFFMKSNGSGTYQSLLNYGAAALSDYNRLLRISGSDNYLLYGVDNGATLWGIASKSLRKLNSGGTGIGDLTVKGVSADAKNTADGNLIVCGTDGSSLYLAKINPASMTLIWEKSYSDPAGSLEAASVVQTADKGCFVVATLTSNGGGKSIYFVKTDANGNAD